MNDERDDLLGDLSRALEIAPSPGFQARVRGAMEEQTAASWLRTDQWRWVAAAGVVAVIAAGLASEVHEPKPVPALELRPGRPDGAPAPAEVLSRTLPVATVTSPPRLATPRPKIASGRPDSRTETVDAAAPDLTVVTNQPELLRRLRVWPGAAGDVADPAATERESSLQAISPPEIVVDAIVVAPIVLDEIE